MVTIHQTTAIQILAHLATQSWRREDTARTSNTKQENTQVGMYAE